MFRSVFRISIVIFIYRCVEKHLDYMTGSVSAHFSPDLYRIILFRLDNLGLFFGRAYDIENRKEKKKKMKARYLHNTTVMAVIGTRGQMASFIIWVCLFPYNRRE